MRSISLVVSVFLATILGCSSSSSSVNSGAEVLVLEVMEIELVPDSQKDVKVKSGKAEKAEGPAAGTGVTAKVENNKVIVAASKEAKEGTHTVKIHGGTKDVELKVKVAKKDVK